MQMHVARLDGFLPVDGGLGAQNPRLLDAFICLRAKDRMIEAAERKKP